jgi:hypothetical protein
MTEYRRLVTDEVREAHQRAMEAKELVFKAQDAADAMADPTPGHRKLRERFRRLLLDARSTLEALDRVYLDAGWEDGGHCTCGGFNNARPHTESCPLFDAGDPPRSCAGDYESARGAK